METIMIQKRRNFVIALLLAGFAITAMAEDGVTDNTILIGQTIGVTGPVSDITKGMIDGAGAYLTHVNQHGGINGRKIVMRIRDDKFDPKTAAANAGKLIEEDHVFAMFQSYGTPHTVAMFPTLTAHGTPLVAPAPGNGVLYAPFKRLVFNVRAKFDDEITKGVQQFATVGINSIGMMVIDDSLGLEALDSFNQAMAARKLTPQAIVKYTRVKPDINGAVATLAKNAPKAVIIVGPPQHTVPLIKAIRASGSNIQVMILSNNSSEALAKDLGPAGVGVLVSQVTPPPHLISSGLGKEFRDIVKAAGVNPSYAAMEGYVSAKVLVEGLRRAGRNLTRDSFIRGMESINKTDLGGIMINYSPTDHIGSDYVDLTMINKEGRFIRCCGLRRALGAGSVKRLEQNRQQACCARRRQCAPPGPLRRSAAADPGNSAQTHQQKPFAPLLRQLPDRLPAEIPDCPLPRAL